MSKYAVVMYDNKSYSFDEKYLDDVKGYMARKESFDLHGNWLSGADIRRIEKLSGGIGPHSDHAQLAADARELFRIEDEKKGKYFWEIVLGINFIRKQKNLPWVYTPAIDEAKRQTHLSDPDDLMTWILWSGLDLSKYRPQPKKFAPSSDNKNGCKKCQNGWIIGTRGVYPCTCNQVGQEVVKAYNAERYNAR